MIQNQNSFLDRWENSVAQHFDFYQRIIDSLAYNMQRNSIKKYFHFAYPYFYQNSLLRLELYCKKQYLGNIFPEEIENYQKINSQIKKNLHYTFSNKIIWPIKGISCGIIGFGIAHYFNIQYSFRLGLIVLPIALNILYSFGNKQHFHKTSNFLDWCLQYRTAKAQIEMFYKTFDNEKRKNVKQILRQNNISLDNAFSQILVLFSKGK